MSIVGTNPMLITRQYIHKVEHECIFISNKHILLYDVFKLLMTTQDLSPSGQENRLPTFSAKNTLHGRFFDSLNFISSAIFHNSQVVE